jgi:hypothetical protein
LSQPKHVQTLVDKFSSVADLVQEKVLPVEPGIRLCKAGIVGQTESPPIDVAVYKYRELIGGLSYISCSTRPDISFIVNQLARYSNDPRQAHWDLAINVLRYLKHTQNWGISLGQGSSLCEIDMKCAEDENLDNVSRKESMHKLNLHLMYWHTLMPTMEQVTMTRDLFQVLYCMSLVVQCPGHQKFNL